MKIPNIYEQDYKKLMVLPILLIIISLFFIPQIKVGIDFKGGTIITLYSDYTIQTENLENDLLQAGISLHSVKQFKTTLGNVVEIEIENEELIYEAEQLRSDFSNIFENVSRLESYVAQTNGENQTIINEYTNERSKADKIANNLFKLSGYTEKTAEQAESTNELKSLVTKAYLNIKSDYEDKLDSILKSNVNYSSITVDIVSPSLSSKFIEKATFVTVIAIVFAVILSFIVFRDIMPSLLVLTGAAADIIICLGAMGLFQIPFTLPSFAALLMMLGFSLDTDMLLTMRMLKQHEGTPKERAYEAMKTGATMSLTDFIAFVALFVLAIMTNISTYYEISAIAICGLIGDIIATWLFNAVILLIYLEKTKKVYI
ncbi:hypothetical protein KO317_01975 [Candidatus Micrarchaeota archaeon]|nr:hypothetical protein [Candidatus Micrarchaeota archaeon]